LGELDAKVRGVVIMDGPSYLAEFFSESGETHDVGTVGVVGEVFEVEVGGCLLCADGGLGVIA
jgi:hypothetical protein